MIGLRSVWSQLLMVGVIVWLKAHGVFGQQFIPYPPSIPGMTLFSPVVSGASNVVMYNPAYSGVMQFGQYVSGKSGYTVNFSFTASVSTNQLGSYNCNAFSGGGSPLCNPSNGPGPVWGLWITIPAGNCGNLNVAILTEDGGNWTSGPGTALYWRCDTTINGPYAYVPGAGAFTFQQASSSSSYYQLVPYGDTSACVSAQGNNQPLILKTCNAQDLTQLWAFYQA